MKKRWKVTTYNSVVSRQWWVAMNLTWRKTRINLRILTSWGKSGWTNHKIRCQRMKNLGWRIGNSKRKTLRISKISHGDRRFRFTKVMYLKSNTSLKKNYYVYTRRDFSMKRASMNKSYTLSDLSSCLVTFKKLTQTLESSEMILRSSTSNFKKNLFSTNRLLKSKENSLKR